MKFNSKPSKLAEIYTGVHQGGPLSPTLFNIYLCKILTKWQKEDITGIPFSKNQQQVNSFNYLGNLISFEEEVDIDNKFSNYLKITITNNVFRSQKTLKKTRMKLCLKKTRIKLYITPALPPLLYGSENLTIKARDKRRITAAEI
jgi:hypothetical protein